MHGVDVVRTGVLRWLGFTGRWLSDRRYATVAEEQKRCGHGVDDGGTGSEWIGVA
jgi:hypothetical protein